jgi:hypothetical protein
VPRYGEQPFLQQGVLNQGLIVCHIATVP